MLAEVCILPASPLTQRKAYGTKSYDMISLDTIANNDQPVTISDTQ